MTMQRMSWDNDLVHPVRLPTCILLPSNTTTTDATTTYILLPSNTTSTDATTTYILVLIVSVIVVVVVVVVVGREGWIANGLLHKSALRNGNSSSILDKKRGRRMK